MNLYQRFTILFHNKNIIDSYQQQFKSEIFLQMVID